MVFVHGCALREALEQVNNDQSISARCSNTGARALCEHSLNQKDSIRSNPRHIGYIRVSTASQLTDRQVVGLEDECDELRIEHASAVAAARPVFDTLMRDLMPFDTLVVLDLDRAFRSAIDAILTCQRLRERHIQFRVLSFPIDTTSDEGELFLGILALFAQFERRIISRRTREGLASARRRGVALGRPPKLAPDTIRAAYEWMGETGLPCRYVAALLGVSRMSLQRGFRRHDLPYPIPENP